ncbi:major facilitator superfamily domain-containing protein [Dichotomocladium elegans]|nr:major facilitator superfamily domain-containing protein [Dichotomocladium elegans]
MGSKEGRQNSLGTRASLENSEISEKQSVNEKCTSTPIVTTLASPGVKKVEVAKEVSTKWNIYAIYIGILSTVSSILASVLLPTFSKLSDIIGRVEAFTVALLIYLVAWIVHATANDYGTFVGARILSTFGDTGISILIPIITGDMTTITNRGFYHGVLQVPTIINMFSTSLAVDRLLYAGAYPGQWRWGYGMIPIIMAVCTLPLLIGLWLPQIKARRAGLLEQYNEERRRAIGGRSWTESLRHYADELDIVGCLLLVGGLAMILLPFVLETTWGGWENSRTLGCLIGGVFAWALFIFWEMKLAKKPVLPLTKWPSNTAVLGIIAMSANTIGSSTNGTYVRTFLMVTRKVTAGQAGFLVIGFSVAAIAFQAITGYLMMRTKVWRPYLMTGILVLIVALAMMTKARQPDSSDAFLVATQVLAGIGTGLFEVPFIVAIQSSVPHEDLAMVTSLYQVGQSITQSVGSTIAGAVWNQMLPQEFAKHIPGEYNAAKIMSSIPFAQNLPPDQYAGLQLAYGRVHRIQTIIALCMSILTFFLVIPMKTFGLRERMDAEKKDKGIAEGEVAGDSANNNDIQVNVKESIHEDTAAKDNSFAGRLKRYFLS